VLRASSGCGKSTTLRLIAGTEIYDVVLAANLDAQRGRKEITTPCCCGRSGTRERTVKAYERAGCQGSTSGPSEDCPLAGSPRQAHAGELREERSQLHEASMREEESVPALAIQDSIASASDREEMSSPVEVPEPITSPVHQGE
jgi:hypothetical protein